MTALVVPFEKAAMHHVRLSNVSSRQARGRKEGLAPNFLGQIDPSVLHLTVARRRGICHCIKGEENGQIVRFVEDSLDISIVLWVHIHDVGTFVV